MRKLSRLLVISWGVVALGLSVLIGPELGWRGWLWLGTHHLLWALGAAGELIFGSSGSGADPR
jgi:hypothetical protein